MRNDPAAIEAPGEVSSEGLVRFQLGSLDADAKVVGRLRSGIGIEIIRSPVVELVPAAQFVAQVDPDRGHSHPHGEPADKTQSLALACLFFLLKGLGFGGHRIKPPAHDDTAVRACACFKGGTFASSFGYRSLSLRESKLAFASSGRKLAWMELRASCRSSSRLKPCSVCASRYSFATSEPKNAGSSELRVTSSPASK